MALCNSRLWGYQMGDYISQLRGVGYRGVLSIEHEDEPSARSQASPTEPITWVNSAESAAATIARRLGGSAWIRPPATRTGIHAGQRRRRVPRLVA